MTRQRQNERLLTQIIVYGFSLAFGLVIASLEALKPTTTGFTIQLSSGTLIALGIGAITLLPCFRLIVYSDRKWPRRFALGVIVLVGLGAFFYPMRVVPAEKWRAVFTGLVVAGLALSVMAGLLLLLHRFFERDEQQWHR